jgi:exopolyphosphatase/guanosine-5'-triphosphate,3'-diphosphate pyrophosphatase
VAAASTDIRAAVDRALETVPADQARSLVGLAGTVTTVSAMAMNLPEYDAAVLHGSLIAAADVSSVCSRLLAMPRRDRALLPFMHPGRVDVIAAGALILDTIVSVGGFAEVVVSETDILDGIAYTLRA